MPSNEPKPLVLVQDFFLALPDRSTPNTHTLQVTVSVDLQDLGFTPSELNKLGHLAQRLEFALSDAFNQVCPAAAVVVEFREDN